MSSSIRMRERETKVASSAIRSGQRRGVRSSRPCVVSTCIAEFYGALYGFAFSLSRSHEEAADLTQQTFFVLVKQQTQIRDFTKIRSWLFTTLRRQFLRNLCSLDCEVELKPEHEQALAVESTALRSTDASLVLHALERVDVRYRDPLELFYIRELSYKEIADLLQVPIGTVMSRLARGKERLRSVLGPADDMTKQLRKPRTAH
jgi:RNA polymerase sigma-70 factor, ECF subfamily